MTRARQPLRLVIGFAILTWLLGGCGGGQAGQTYTRYSFSCCTADDVQGWYPGKTVSLHWVAQNAGVSADNRDVPITLTATLTGPFADVTSLKGGAAPATTLSLPTLVADNRIPTTLTSSFTLPADLAPGFYNLAFTDDYGNGNSWGGGSVVQVATSESTATPAVTGQPPLRLPVLAAGATCPVSPMISLLGVAPNYGVGDYPAYLSGQANWYAGGQGAILMVASSYPGSLLIRGGQLDGAEKIMLAEDGVSASANQAVVAKEKLYGVEVVAGGHPSAAALELKAVTSTSLWRAWFGSLSTTGPGCFGLQVDGDGFTKFIVFQVHAGPAPPG
jgi:hypothetical protein